MKLLLHFVLFASVIILATSKSVVAEPDNIDVILFKKLPYVVQKLKDREIRNFGVLPFRFQDNAGIDHTTGNLIQFNLAARTERVIAYIRDIDDPVNVVFGMLPQARLQNPNASYHTEDARRDLLALKYKFPVDEMPATLLDGYLTGSIEVSKDWKQSTLRFELYDPKKQASEELDSITFPTDRKMLMQFGRAYSLSATGWNSSQQGVQTRGIFSLIEHDENNPTTEPTPQAAEKTLVAGTPIQGNPWEKFPVTMIIKYDGKSQPLLTDAISSPYNFTVADPKPNQRVTFELTNHLQERIAVVLSVNGKNLIYEENANDPDGCNKFVLEPQASYSIPGLYLPGLKSIRPLLGQQERDTSTIAKQYPPDAVGIITLSVYRSVPLNDPGGISHLRTQPALDKKNDNAQKVDNAANALASDATSPNNANTTLEFLPDDENEFWYNRFQPSLVRSGGKQPMARGSFHPPSTSVAAKTWNELSKEIGKNAMLANNTRGLIAPGGVAQQQKLDSTKLGPVSQTDVAVIRYLSVTQ